MREKARKVWYMIRELAMLLATTLVVALITAGGAEGHTISKDRVQGVSHRLVKDLCESDRTCNGVEVEPCHREAKHIARCKVHYFGEDSRSPYDCHWIFEWSIRDGSNALHLSRRVFENTFRCHRRSGGHTPRAARSGEAPRADGSPGPDIRGLKVR